MSETTADISPALIDMLAFLKAQRGERYRAFVVHALPRKGKTLFARKLAEIAQGAYIDVLATVAADPELAQSVDLLDAGLLKRLALEAAQAGAELVLIDEFQFLLPVCGGDLSALFELARKLAVSETQATVGFIMQTVPDLETWGLTNSVGQSRILRLDEIESLK